jgi:hypothetical protein
LWKTQTPWPSLRGFLYDWYLESTSALIGARSALRSPRTILLLTQSWQLYIVNRQVFPVLKCSVQQIGVRYTWIDLHGTSISSGEILSSDDIPAMTSRLLGTENDQLKWPKQCTDVCFLRLQEVGGCSIQSSTTWYWLTDPTLGDAGNFSQLGELRSRHLNNGYFEIDIESCVVEHDRLFVDIILRLKSESPDILFYPSVSIHIEPDGTQLLPLVDVDDTNIVILPGTSQLRHLESQKHVSPGTIFSITVSSWNAPVINQYLFCSARFSRTQSKITTV